MDENKQIIKMVNKKVNQFCFISLLIQLIFPSLPTIWSIHNKRIQPIFIPVSADHRFLNSNQKSYGNIYVGHIFRLFCYYFTLRRIFNQIFFLSTNSITHSLQFNECDWFTYMSIMQTLWKLNVNYSRIYFLIHILSAQNILTKMHWRNSSLRMAIFTFVVFVFVFHFVSNNQQIYSGSYIGFVFWGGCNMSTTISIDQ